MANKYSVRVRFNGETISYRLKGKNKDDVFSKAKDIIPGSEILSVRKMSKATIDHLKKYSSGT